MSVSEHQLSLLPAICQRAVDEDAVPGGVLYVGRREDLLIQFPFGMRALEPDPETATLNTIYDLASLTKSLATATVLFRAVERGLVNLMEPLSRWLPETGNSELADLVPRDLLLHVSGLPAGPSMPHGDAVTTESVVRSIADAGPEAQPGKRFVYSDTGYILLAFLAERVLEEPLDKLFGDLVAAPLGMQDTRFGVQDHDIGRCAPTETFDGVPLRGVVHDPNSRRMGGVSGHAGVFGTAADLAKYCRMVLNRGRCGASRVLQPATVDRMVEPVAVPDGKLRSYGWDVDSQYSSPRGELFPKRGIGHTGFTGTSIWIDPPSGVFIILLTNRVHPELRDGIVRLRRVVANVVASAVLA